MSILNSLKNCEIINTSKANSRNFPMPIGWVGLSRSSIKQVVIGSFPRQVKPTLHRQRLSQACSIFFYGVPNETLRKCPLSILSSQVQWLMCKWVHLKGEDQKSSSTQFWVVKRWRTLLPSKKTACFMSWFDRVIRIKLIGEKIKFYRWFYKWHARTWLNTLPNYPFSGVFYILFLAITKAWKISTK